ncbi:sensor histidine kinase [Paenibacillus cremeus]|uniref:histidine kinase n=1 Tax=Paenibacillus cremeus TaxID=2163881 RepID=A0A559K7U0_9BACL|nr:sensor histidine kinase [Paenibacillus cremeus]TVY08201.1 sensor histidine kinase [Paenibacillus cremeus]
MLKTKMFLSFSMVSLFIVGITCGIFYWKYTNDIQNQSLALSGIISKQFSETVDIYIRNIEELSLAVSISPPVQTNLLNYIRATSEVEKEVIGYRLNPFLFDFSYPKPYVQGISIYTPDGFVYDYTKRLDSDTLATFSVQELSQFKETLLNQKFILIPSILNSRDGAQERIVAFIRNINRIPTQQVIGYVNIHIDVNAFNSLVLASTQANVIEQTMRLLIVDRDGTVIYENGSSGVGEATASGSFDSSALKNGAEGELIWKGAPYLYTYKASDYTGWKTIILMPKATILEKQNRIRTIVILVGLVTMLLIAVVSYTLSHQITLPLQNMMRKMSSVERGNFHQRMSYTANNEIGRLSRMYNLMLDSISRLIHEVYESKLAETNAQLSALHAQINPHFLYNTLNVMKSISRLRGLEEVAEISESLASLFQYSMKNLHQPVTLREEIEHILNYFKIQQHRFGGRIQLHCDIPEELLQALLLKLTIQPLVENAVNHGLKRMRSGGRVHIQATQAGDLLVVTVTDNGIGMEEQALEQLNTRLGTMAPLQQTSMPSEGIGLLNIQQRIRLFYGSSPSYGVRLTCPVEGGMCVVMAIPYRNESGQQ